MGRKAKRNPTEIMRRLIEDDPNASFDRIFKSWWREVKDDPDCFEAIGIHAGTNIWVSLTRQRRAPARPTAAQAAEREIKVASAVQKILSVLTLDFVMPNGMALRDCTGTQVAKFGGIFAKIGQKAGKRLVGEALTDAQIKAMSA
jgi:hypothetical protein